MYALEVAIDQMTQKADQPAWQRDALPDRSVDLARRSAPRLKRTRGGLDIGSEILAW